MVRESVVPFPFISQDDGSREDVLLNQAYKGMVISFVVGTLHQEALSSRSAVSTKDPLPQHSSADVVFPLPEFRFVYLYDVAKSSNLSGRSVLHQVLSHALPKRCKQSSYCLVVHGEDSGCITHADSVAEHPEQE